MIFLLKYWSQITVLVSAVGFLLKPIFDYRLKNKELRFKYFYELKSQKIIELYSKIVEIQMIVDRKKKDDEENFERNMFKKRRELDKYYWESEFYFSKHTKLIFRHFMKWLPMFENKEIMQDDPAIEMHFQKVSDTLIREFKKELK